MISIVEQNYLLEASNKARANRTRLLIDMSAIRSNIDLAKSLHPQAKVMPVIKGDAYGLGAEYIARDLQAHGVDAFGVENVYEAMLLKHSGIEKPIVVLDGCVPENIDLALENDLIPGIASVDLLHLYNRTALARNKKISIWIYYNCGLNRSGYSCKDDFRQLMSLVKTMSNISVGCIYSQLTDSHNDFALTLKQVEKFKQAISLAREELSEPFETSLYASHGIMSCSELSDFDWIRPGLMMYGENCFSPNIIDRVNSVADNLKPALELRARLVQKVEIKEDANFSYTQQNFVKKGVVLGSVSIGYSSGLFPNNGNTYYLYNEKQLPLKNNAIGMDFSQVEIPEDCDIPMYSWITIFGAGDKHYNSMRNFSRQMNISPYALLSALKVAREYQNALPL